MLYLYPDRIKMKGARKAFHEGMLDFILTRIDNISSIVQADTSRIEAFFDIVVNDLLDQILVGTPSELIAAHNLVTSYAGSSADLQKGIKHVFSYETFIKKAKHRYDAYSLAQSIDIRTCPYCNIHYTHTVVTEDGEKVTRPQFDHYFDKDTYPLLAVSFYNLVPCCSICNSSIKGSAEMNLTDFLHPYIDNSPNDFRFTYNYDKNAAHGVTIDMITANNSKAQRTAKLFSIEDVYRSHSGLLADLLKTKNFFSDKYLSLLATHLLRNVRVSSKELYRIVFGAEYDTDNFINMPFSKFKSDILKELGII